MVVLAVSLACMYAYSSPLGWPFLFATMSATSMAINTFQMTTAANKVVYSIEICEDGEHVKI